MPQMTISSDPMPSFEGQIAYPMLPRVVVTRRIVGGNISYGVAVARASDQSVRLVAAAADITTNFAGIVVRQEYREPNDGLGYSVNVPAPILRKGYIWVGVEGAVTEEAPVYARVTASGGNTVLGAFRADADTANAALVPNARFITSTTAAGLAIVEVW
jgi:hypothetical protein